MFYVKVCGTWQAIGRKHEALSDQKGVFLRGVFETSCATHGEKGVLMRQVSLGSHNLGKTVLTRCYRTAGIIKRVKASCTVGAACMYGARICACFLRYRMNASLDQRPFTFMTSKGTPRRRYSRVHPIRIPWPCKGSSPAARAAFANSEMNMDLVRGLCPDL